MDKIRPIKANDYQVLNLYWALAGESVDSKWVYPEHSSLVFERDGKLLYCVGIHKVEGIPIAYIEGLIRDPSKGPDFNAVQLLQANVEARAREMGCRVIIAISKNAKLTQHHEALGYNRVSDGAFLSKGVT